MSARQRILQGTAATLSWGPSDSDGEASTVDPGTVTVTVSNAAGTALVTDAATTSSGVNRTYALSATHTALLDVLTVVWKVAGVTVGTTYVDVVGGFYFTVAELRVDQPALAVVDKYPTATLVQHRATVEAFIEAETGMAWVPRFSVVDGVAYNGNLITPLFAVRSVRWYRTYTDATNYTEAAPAQIALLRGTTYGTLEGGYLYGRTVAGVEHGQLQPTPDLKRVAMWYCRMLATKKIAGLDDNATSYTTPEGQTVGFPTSEPTGVKGIDRVLRSPAHDFRLVGVA